MNYIKALVVLLVIGAISCKSPEQQSDKLKVAKAYYQGLDNADPAMVATLLADSLLTRESQYDYEQTFSKSEYVQWMKWDSVFDPTYKILEIELHDSIIKARISKIDQRLLFLHKEPMITNEVLRFDKGKISGVERTEYLNFNEERFVKQREQLLNWIDQNHPELSGFIHDQTREGGLKYLKAIQLYRHRE